MAKTKPPIKKKYIETPEKLLELFNEYVEHEKENPMYKKDYVGTYGTEKNTPLQVPVTFEGFECYLFDKEIKDLKDYASNKEGRYESYAPIITHIRQKCFVQNYKGASVGLFNANIIAKKLGLIDKTENKHEVSSIKISYE